MHYSRWYALSLIAIIFLYAISREIIFRWLLVKDIPHRLWFKLTHLYLFNYYWIFNKLFPDNNKAFHLAVAARKQWPFLKNLHYTYGEIDFFSFADILEFVMPKSGEIFYDLGSGSGKAVYIAALLHDFSKVIGIEIATPLYNFASELTEKFTALTQRLRQPRPVIEFINCDIATYDFTDADIIFMNSTTFEKSFWQSIDNTLIRLKKGTRLILTTSTFVDKPGFQLLKFRYHIMSWGIASVYIYEKL